MNKLEADFTDKLLLAQFNNKIIRRQIIKKIKRGSPRIESDAEIDAQQLEILQNWSTLNYEDKLQFVKLIQEDDNFMKGQQLAEKARSTITSAPGNVYKKIKAGLNKILGKNDSNLEPPEEK